MHHPTEIRFQHTKIIVTLGPATDQPEILREMILRGVDIVRLNMAHAKEDWVRDRVGRLRQACAEVGRQVAVMMDVKGPEIRTGELMKPIVLQKGDRFELYVSQSIPPSQKGVSVNYSHLPEDVKVGKEILVDSGLIRLKVLFTDKDKVVCEVVIGGELGSKRHINLPGVLVRLPALTSKDKEDLRIGAEVGIDFVALSFVRQASDVLELKSFLKSLNCRARVIAKIEDQAGVKNCDAIIKATDGIMVARGDLGIEIDYSELPIVQSHIVEACRFEGKPVIVATQLLESMIDSPIPTRAEISDVSTAVREQADAVMLSGETSLGKYPLEAISVMTNIIKKIEPTVAGKINKDIQLREPKTKMLRSAAYLAQEMGEGAAILVFTRSGFLGYVLAAMRARNVRIFAFTDDEITFRQLLFPWGVEPFLMNQFHTEDPELTISEALETLRFRNWCEPGATLVVITNVLTGGGQVIDTLQLRVIPPHPAV